jgi:two-component system, NarL family, nitrate/nitrite response regulator NarL
LRRLLQQWRFSIAGEGRDITESIESVTEDLILSLAVCTIDPETASQSITSLINLRLRFETLKVVVIADFTTAAAPWHQAIGVSDAVLARDISGKALQRSIDLVMVGQRFLSAPLLQGLSPEREIPIAPRLLIPVARLLEPIMATGTIKSVPLQETSEAANGDPTSMRNGLSLSDRECQILRCLVRGDPNKVIARELSIAEATVKVHVKGLLRKLRAANRTQAAVWAHNHGLTTNGIEVLAASGGNALQPLSAG